MVGRAAARGARSTAAVNFILTVMLVEVVMMMVIELCQKTVSKEIVFEKKVFGEGRLMSWV